MIETASTGYEVVQQCQGARACFRFRQRRFVYCALVEERYRDLQDMRDLLQPARADTVGAPLVLLHLLEGKTERIAEFPLAHGEHPPPHAHAAADVLVDGIWRLSFGHHSDHQAASCSVAPSASVAKPRARDSQRRSNSRYSALV